jgi:plasmid stabilization system protein ParE
MTTNLPAVAGDHDTTVHLVRGGRRDITVHAAAPTEAIESTQIVPTLRAFFAAIEAEAERLADHPEATVQALARVDAMLADLRYVRDRLHQITAVALKEQGIRRLTVEGVASVEAKVDTRRTDWDNETLLDLVLAALPVRYVDIETGEMMEPADMRALLAPYFRPDWRLTALRNLGIDPDEWCTVAEQVPTLRMIDNLERTIR